MFMLTLGTLYKMNYFSIGGGVFQNDLRTSVPGILQGDLSRAVFATSCTVYSCLISFVLWNRTYV